VSINNGENSTKEVMELCCVWELRPHWHPGV